MTNRFLAIDLGAESGRAILGTLSGGRLALEELHRFPNTAVRLPTGLYWDTFRLFHEIRHALSICGRERKLTLDGVGIDTWGVDFGLLGAGGALIDNPRHYRDPRTNGMFEKTFAVIPREEIFRQTGIQFMPINSLYQLHVTNLSGSQVLDIAAKLLFMPDLLNYWLTGVQKSETTIASTSQFYNPVRKAFASELLVRLGVAPRILPDLVDPGTRLGTLLPEIADATGLAEGTPVYATASHDTASAVAAVPAEEGTGWAYISSGTWSLMGAEVDAPVINETSLALNFTNEVGAGGKIRLLKNIAGLWLLQECRHDWILQGQEYTYSELMRLAEEAEPCPTLLEPDAFREPGHMPEQIAAYCRKTSQPVPNQPGQMCRVILESLAGTYRTVLQKLELLTSRRLDTIHIVGGGSQNTLLNQFAADATGRTVIAGPAEATAAGNILVQAIGAGVVPGLAEAREIVRQSSALTSYWPRRTTASR